MLNIRIVALLALVQLAFVNIHQTTAQEQALNMFANVGAQVLLAPTGFDSISAVPNPGVLPFENASTFLQPMFHIGGDVPVAQNLRVGLMLGGSSYRLHYSAFEPTMIADGSGGVRQATLLHDLSMQWQSLLVAPTVRLEVDRHLALSASVPLQLPFNSDYRQTLRFTDPDGLPFVNGEVEVVTGRGVLRQLRAVVPEINLKAEGMFALDKKNRWTLTPWIGATAAITSWIEQTSFSTIGIAAGVGVRYDSRKILPKRDTVVRTDTVRLLSKEVDRDTIVLADRSSEEFRATADSIVVFINERYHELIPEPPPVFIASVSLAFEGKRGDLQQATAKLQRYEHITYLPVVPIVRFANNEANLPARYARTTSAELKKTSENELIHTVDHHHYQVLNIIAKRAKETNSTIIVNSSKPLGVDARAATAAIESVRRYLITDVGMNKTKVLAGDVYDNTTMYTDVEISSTNQEMFAPVVLRDTILTREIPTLLVRPEVISEAGVKTWEIVVKEQGDTIRVISGTDEILREYPVDISEYVFVKGQNITNVEVVLRATDKQGTELQTQPSMISIDGQQVLEEQRVTGRVVSVVRVPSATVNQEAADGFVPLTNSDPLPMDMNRLGIERSLYKGVEMYIYKKRQP